MAELSKCCSDPNVANIAVPSNIAKCSRVLYKKVGSLQMLQNLQIWRIFQNIAVLLMVAIIAQTLRILQMLQRLSEKKSNIAEPTDMVELSNVAVLSNVANITVPSKYCKVFEGFANIAKCCIVFHKEKKLKRFANVTEPTNMAEFLQMWQNLQRFRMLQILQGP